MDYDAALAELYQAPHASFVEERKRLAAALKAAGDKPGAATLAKRTRPTVSAWVVNQLWWHARDAFEALMTTAAKLRDGDLSASAAHRDAIVNLRGRATAMLADAGHGTTESTVRRVAQTLTAIAATGSWEPDAAGTLTEDRDPPGFDAAMLAPVANPGDGAAAAQKIVERTLATNERAAQVAAAAVAWRTANPVVDDAVVSPPLPVTPPPPASPPPATTAPAPAPVAAPPPMTDRTDLASELRAAKAELAAAEQRVESLRDQLAAAKTAVTAARAKVDDLQSHLD